MVRILLIISLLFCVKISSAQEAGDSPNLPELLEKLPFEAERPIARELRYIYGSALELKKKKFDPFFVTNEAKEYFDYDKPDLYLNTTYDAQYQAFQQQGEAWINANQANWSASELANYTSFQNSMEQSMNTMHTYFAAMNALSSLAYAWAEKDANTLMYWASNTTHCVGKEAEEGTILHLDIMRLTVGERFKFHSANDFIVTATLETSEGLVLSRTQIMKMWRNSKKKKVMPDYAVPILRLDSLSEDKRMLLEPVSKDAFMIRHALLINAVIQDLYEELEAKQD